MAEPKTEIYGIKVNNEIGKARIELLLCGTIPPATISASEIIEMLSEYKLAEIALCEKYGSLENAKTHYKNRKTV